ncbi:hypothetical protein HQ447_09650, partial [bacterium]|nr:hypothetical protein [bacterium]
MKTICIIHLMLLALLAPALAVNPPGIINHQGRIAVNGANYDGTGYFKFALVNGGTNTSVQATATAVIEAEMVTTITLTHGGAGYATAPAVTFSGGGGSGAAATATISNGAVTALTLTSGGNHYMSDPEVIIAPPPANIQHLSYWSNDATSNGGSQPASAVTVPISKGHYAVLLGDTSVANMATTIPASVFADHDTVALRLWFATASDGPFEILSPDRRIAATGYALAAQQAAAVAPGGVTSTMLADDAVTAAKLANGAVTSPALAAGAVTSSAIADGSVTSYDLALGATGLVRKPVMLAEVDGGGSLMAPTDTPGGP